MKNLKMLGNILLLLTAMIWGTAFVFQRVGMETIEPATFNTARMALAAAVIGAAATVIRLKRKKSPAARSAAEQKLYDRNTVLGGLCCGCFLAAGSILQQAGLVYTTAGKAGFITALYMLLVPVIGFVFLKRKNTWLVWLAVLLGIGGMYLLCVNGGFTLSPGDSLCCLCALFFSFHILCCDHFARRGDPIGISAVQFAAAAVISAAVAAFTETPTPEKIMSALVPILYCGIVSGGIGYTLQMTAQRFTDPTVASLLMSMESVFAAVAGAVMLGERMSLRELSGCVIMTAAIVLVQIPLPARKSKEDKTDGDGN